MKQFILFIITCLPAISVAQPALETAKSMRDMAYPYATKTVLLSDSIAVAYADEGAGPQTLLFIHGLGSYLPAWQKNIDALKPYYRCIAIDLPGYGKSDKGDYAYNMSFFANIIRQLIQTLQLQNVVLVGHSMGGQIALTTALQSTTDISKIVLLAPAGFETFTAPERQILGNLYTPELLLALPVAQIRKNFEINFVQFPEDAEFMYQDRLFMRETTEYARYCAMIPRCVAGMLDEPVFERLSEIQLPVLVLYGEADALIPNRFLHPGLSTRAVAEAGAERLPDARIEMIPDAGHFVQWEGAAQVNAAIRDFIR